MAIGLVSCQPKGRARGVAAEWVQEGGTASCSVAYCPASSLFKLSAVGILMCKSTQSHVRGTSALLSPPPLLTLTGSTSHATLILITEAAKQLLDTKISLALAGEKQRQQGSRTSRAIWSFSWFRCHSTNALSLRLHAPVAASARLCPSCTCSSRQLVVQFLCCYWTI